MDFSHVREAKMRRLLIAALYLGLSVAPAAALSEMEGLVQYDCQTPSCNLACTGPNTNLAAAYRTLFVFQWKSHPRRLWIAVNDAQHVLGDAVTCRFEGKATFQFGSSPLPPPNPGCTCIGNQCTPPGCKP
jgi:hypothetical protein